MKVHVYIYIQYISCIKILLQKLQMKYQRIVTRSHSGGLAYLMKLNAVDSLNDDKNTYSLYDLTSHQLPG